MYGELWKREKKNRSCLENIFKNVGKRNCIDLFIVFFVCFLPKFIIAREQIMINTLSDEISSMSIAAFLAGYDWRDVVSKAGYYGIGYIFIFFPLFKMGLSAMQIYKTILAMNAVLIGLTGVVCYQIQKNIFEIKPRIARIVIACTCGSMSIFSTTTTRARNEDIYLLCGWLFAYVFLKLFKYEEKKIKYEFILLTIILYMLTIHSRSVVYIISLIIISFLYYILFRRTIVTKKFWILLSLGYLVIQKLLNIYQMWVWQSDGVRNSSVGNVVTSAMSKINIDIDMVKSICMIVFGQFFTAFSLSGGLFLISLVLFCLWGYECLKNKDNISNRKRMLWVTSAFFLLAILISIGGQSITWGVHVYKGIASNSLEYIYAYKAFTYMRYMGSYVPQFMMGTLVIAWENNTLWKKSCRITMFLFIPLFLFWIDYIMPFVENIKSNMEFFLTIVSLPQEVENSRTVWNITFLLLFSFVFLWIFKTDRRSFVWKLLIVGVLYTSIERTTIFYNKTLLGENKYLARIDKGCEVVEILHDELINDELGICVVDATTNRTDHQNWYLYQFMNYDLHIIPGTKEEIVETEIIVSTHRIGEFLQGKYAEFKLDKNEYIYSKNEEYTSIIKCMGYEEF